MRFLSDVVLLVVLVLAAWWHFHKLRQHGLSTTKLRLENEKLILEIQELKAKQAKVIRREQGASLLADALARAPAGSAVRELIPVSLITRVLVPNRGLIEQEARNLRPGTPTFPEELARLKADDAFLMALGANDHIAKLGVLQLANLAEVFPARAGTYLRVLLGFKDEAPEDFRALLRSEVARLGESAGNRHLGNDTLNKAMESSS